MYHEIIFLLGGIKGFASDTASVMKWCLNRPTQAKNTSCFRTLAGLASKTGIYKPLRPSQILKTEKMVTNAIDVITNEYINPFGLDIDKNHLYNLSSGIAIEDSLATEIINLNTTGKELARKFKQEWTLVKITKLAILEMKRSARTFMTHCQGIKRGHLRTVQKHMLL